MTIETKIIETITNLFSGADERNWEKVRNTMADNVLLDYASMGGGPAANIAAEDVITAWKALLPGFDKTHHHISDLHITVDGGIVQAHFSGKADHFLNGSSWTVAGTYDAELEHINDSWKVTKFKFNLREQSGDLALPSKAMEVVKQKDN
jgi:hypothetical protein